MSYRLPQWSDVDRPASRAAELIWAGRCARIGETAVASTYVHTFDPFRPDSVGVVIGADAGQVFYHRAGKSEIVHIDVFHSVGEVDHFRAASWLMRSLEARRYLHLADLIDIQTGTGGGRLSGSLKFGRKASLRRAHMNHVHIAAALCPEEAEAILWLVAGAECAVMECGLEIRKVARIELQTAAEGNPADLSPYSSPSDSNLRGDTADSAVSEQQLMQSATELAEEFGSVEQVERILDELASCDWIPGPLNIAKEQSPGWQDHVEKLISRGLIRREGRKIALTDLGWELRDFLVTKSREIEMQFRRLLRRCPRIKPPRERETYATARTSRPGRAFGVRSVPLDSGEWPNSLAVSETVAAALTRCPDELAIQPGDLRVYPRKTKKTTDVCLLIDASASMAGKRIRAAKYLAQHLLLTSRDKVAVVVFQEGYVKVEVPFTRNFGLVQAGLSRIHPMGLTPLAEGLISAMEYIKESRVKKPLLLLITDGIPTVPKWTLNPLEDSLQAAAQLSAARVRFGCIGLQPNKAFLQALSKRARGTLYIVDELEKETLANIAHRERVK